MVGCGHTLSILTKAANVEGYSAEGLLYVDDGEERYITTASYITETNHTRGDYPLYLNESYVQDASLTEMDGQKRVRLKVDPEALPLINSWLDKNILREGRAVSLEAEYWIGADGKLISQTFLIGIMGQEVFGEGEDWETEEEVQGQEVIRVRYPFTNPDSIPCSPAAGGYRQLCSAVLTDNRRKRMKKKKILAAALAAGCLFLGGCLKAPVPPAAEAVPSGTAQGNPLPPRPFSRRCSRWTEFNGPWRKISFWTTFGRSMRWKRRCGRTAWRSLFSRQWIPGSGCSILRPLLSMEVEQRLLGQTTTQSYYYAGGMMYWRSGDTKLREETAWEEVFRMKEGIPADIVLSAEEEETETGARISMRLDGESFRIG